VYNRLDTVPVLDGRTELVK